MITMLHYSIKLYQNIPFYEGQNLVITKSYPHKDEDGYFSGMSDYLATQTPTEFVNIAPIAIEKETKIILPMDEYDAAISEGNYNYAMLQSFKDNSNTSIGVYYFFISNITRMANKTVVLQLSLDSLNTFSNSIFPNLTDRTLVKREHRDRFYVNSNGFYVQNFGLSRIVDPVSEGMSVIQDRFSSYPLVSNEDGGLGNSVKWYLIYKAKEDLTTSNITNPVDVFACADQALKVKDAAVGPIVTWGTGTMATGYYYYITPDSGQFLIDITYFTAPSAGSSIPTTNTKQYSFNVDGSVMLILYRNAAGTLFIVDYWGDGSVDFYTLHSQDSFSAYGDSFPVVIQFTNCARLWKTNVKYSTIQGGESGEEITLNSGTNDALYTRAIDEIDRTDSRLMKIIECPYPPSNVIVIGDTFELHGFTYANGLWKLGSVNFTFKSELKKINFSKLMQSGSVSFTSKLAMDQALFTPNTGYNDYSNEWTSNLYTYIGLDSKLYHSDFFTLKFVYDSFSLPILLEKMAYNGYVNASDFYINVTFQQTNTINSNLCYTFSIGLLSDRDYNSPLDYNLTLLSTRNNELPIFSNNYLDYIRSGYNYDKKSKMISAVSRWSTVAFQGIGGVAAATLGGGLAPLAAVGMGVSALSSLTTAITGQMKDDNAIEAKLQGLRMATTNVAGSDDINLLRKYNGDNLILYEFHVNNTTRRNLNRLFHYYGYATNQCKKPDLSSRQCFNFLQASPYFTAPTKAILGKFYDGIESAFEQGITFIHRCDKDGEVYYDFDQKRFNWEITILNQRSAS